MDEFHFLRPFWLLAALPALVVWWRLWRQQDSVHMWQQVVDQHLLEHLIVGDSKHRGPRPIQLLLVLWMICAIALAGPAWRMEPSPFADDEAGLVVLLKVSGSMMATDVQPSRLERAKHKLRDLLEQRQGSSTGLIVYSGSAHLVMPLTRDDRIVSSMVEDLTPDLMPVDGDVLVAALQLAQQVLTKSGVPDVPGVASRILGPVGEKSIAVDMIVQNLGADGTTDFTFTVGRGDYDEAFELLEAVRKDLDAREIRGDNKICKVSVVGMGMRSHAGVATQMFDALAAENINIQMISTSEIKISVVLAERYLELAVRSIHTAFGLSKDVVSEE